MILEKAIEVFAEKGSQQTTIADIARRARIAQGTVYVYFSGKEELLNECMQEDNRSGDSDHHLRHREYPRHDGSPLSLL